MARPETSAKGQAVRRNRFQCTLPGSNPTWIRLSGESGAAGSAWARPLSGGSGCGSRAATRICGAPQDGQKGACSSSTLPQRKHVFSIFFKLQELSGAWQTAFGPRKAARAAGGLCKEYLRAGRSAKNFPAACWKRRLATFQVGMVLTVDWNTEICGRAISIHFSRDSS